VDDIEDVDKISVKNQLLGQTPEHSRETTRDMVRNESKDSSKLGAWRMVDQVKT
jgi:hypothetical protein